MHEDSFPINISELNSNIFQLNSISRDWPWQEEIGAQKVRFIRLHLLKRDSCSFGRRN
jgi:hypothetical protein